MRMRLGCPALATVLVAGPLYGAAGTGRFSVSDPFFHAGTRDASAAVALTGALFAVGSDEDAVLRVYRNDRSGPPVVQVDLAAALSLDRKFPEPDLEGAARVGERVYWITSHGRNQEGQDRPSRRRFFATELKVDGDRVQLRPVGMPCTRLLSDLARDARYGSFELARAATRAPKKPDALNIEGLCAAADGSLLIGFRNPVPGGRALVAPLLNPGEVVEGHVPRFGDPVLLSLGGYGIRDFAMEAGRGIIIAGSFDGKGKQRLFAWEGVGTVPRRMADLRLNDLNPEAVVIYPGQGLRRFQILSDDSRDAGEGSVTDAFRSVWIEAPQGP